MIITIMQITLMDGYSSRDGKQPDSNKATIYPNGHVKVKHGSANTWMDVLCDGGRRGIDMSGLCFGSVGFVNSKEQKHGTANEAEIPQAVNQILTQNKHTTHTNKHK